MRYTPVQDHAASVALQDLKIVADELANAADHLNQADEYERFLPTIERLENQLAALIGRVTLHRQKLNANNPPPQTARMLLWQDFVIRDRGGIDDDGNPV